MKPAALIERAETALSPTIVRGVLDAVANAFGSGAMLPDDVIRIERAAFDRAVSITRDRPEDAAPILLDCALPRVFGVLGSTPRHRHWRQSGLRDLMRDWLEQYDQSVTALLRNVLLDALNEELNDRPSFAAIWMVAAVGIRRVDTVKLLRHIADRDGSARFDEPHGSLGDNAARVLATLARSESDARTARDLLLIRLRRSPSWTLLAGLSQVSSAITVDVLTEVEHLLMAGSGRTEAQLIDGFVSLLGRSAETHPQDELLQTQVLETLNALAGRDDAVGRIALGSHILPACYSPEVPRVLLSLAEKERENRPARTGGLISHSEYLWLLRAQESLLGPHLVGWRRPDVARIASRLLRDTATMPTGTAGDESMSTQSMQQKEQAWQLVARAGLLDATSWLDEAMLHEDSGFVQDDILRAARCLPFEDIPSSVERLLSLEMPDGSGVLRDSAFFVRSEGVKLASVIPTHRSFLALLNTSFNLGGNSLRLTADALSDVGLWMAAKSTDDEQWLMQSLAAAVEGSGTPSWQRGAAVTALAAVALEHVSIANLSLVWRIVQQFNSLPPSELTDYVLGEAITSLGAYADELTEAMRFNLTEWALNRSDEIGWRSVEALIRSRTWGPGTDQLWSKLRPTLFGKRSSSSPRVGENATAWAAHCLGLLFVVDPQSVAPEVARYIETGDWFGIEELSRYIRWARRQSDTAVGGTRTDLAPIVPALIARARRAMTSHGAETATLMLLSVASPPHLYALVRESGRHWMPAARRMIAETLRREDMQPLTEDGLKLLSELTTDLATEVRAAAFESLRAVDPTTLDAHIAEWSDSVSWRDRERAVTAAAYAPRRNTGNGHASNHASERDDSASNLERATHDSDPRVREAARLATSRRRKRLAADSACEQVEEAVRTGRELVSFVHWTDCVTAWGDAWHGERFRALLRLEQSDLATRQWLADASDSIDKRLEKDSSGVRDYLPPEPLDLHEEAGTIEIAGHVLDVDATLWRSSRVDSLRPDAWGAAAETRLPMPSELRQHLILDGVVAILRLESNVVREVAITASSTHHLLMSGTGGFPAR